MRNGRLGGQPDPLFPAPLDHTALTHIPLWSWLRGAGNALPGNCFPATSQSYAIGGETFCPCGMSSPAQRGQGTPEGRGQLPQIAQAARTTGPKRQLDDFAPVTSGGGYKIPEFLRTKEVQGVFIS